METIIAENKVLKKLANVPENFGFDLEEIKVNYINCRLQRNKKLKILKIK